jgi:hypothetical protein
MSDLISFRTPVRVLLPSGRGDGSPILANLLAVIADHHNYSGGWVTVDRIRGGICEDHSFFAGDFGALKISNGNVAGIARAAADSMEAYLKRA